MVVDWMLYQPLSSLAAAVCGPCACSMHASCPLASPGKQSGEQHQSMRSLPATAGEQASGCAPGCCTKMSLLASPGLRPCVCALNVDVAGMGLRGAMVRSRIKSVCGYRRRQAVCLFASHLADVSRQSRSGKRPAASLRCCLTSRDHPS